MKKYQQISETLRLVNGFPPRLKKLIKEKAGKDTIKALEADYEEQLAVLEDQLHKLDLPREQVAN